MYFYFKLILLKKKMSYGNLWRCLDKTRRWVERWGGGGVKRGITLVGNYVININMADDEKSPLLQSADEDEGPRLRHHHTFPTLHKGLDLSPDSPSESDHIVCVFVVTFDTRSGMARYCYHNIT